MSEEDSTHQFLIYAQKIINEARFIADSIPNVELFSVERTLRQLHALQLVLINLNDAWLSEDEIIRLIDTVTGIALPLHTFQQKPPPPRNAGVSTVVSGGRGRPRYILDLGRAIELHDLGNTWEAVADAMGVGRRTLYDHLNEAQLVTARKPFTIISDDDLDEHISAISMVHPLAGSAIIMGHLESKNIHLSSERVQESLRRVDAIGVLVRWTGVIKRRVYRVRGSNALWHMDGNEKLRPWGFYIHGCIDGFSRLIIYLRCCNNKRMGTVEALFMEGVARYGWPSRGRGDYGTENNGVERRMIAHWGEAHHAYLRGRSIQNIRIERLWRDVRRDTIEAFRQIFLYLEENGLLDMDLAIHRLCLYVVFQPRIQRSLDETLQSWNHHKIRTAGNKTPTAIYEVSKEKAMNRGYWHDPGDDIQTASEPSYGHDPSEPLPPADELDRDPMEPEREDYFDLDAERDAGVLVNDEDEIAEVMKILTGIDLMRDDGNWGIDVYCHVVVVVATALADSDSD